MRTRFDWNHPRSIDRELYEQLHASLDFIRRGESTFKRSNGEVALAAIEVLEFHRDEHEVKWIEIQLIETLSVLD